MSKHTLNLPPDLQVVEFSPPRVYDVIKTLYLATVMGDQGHQYSSRVYTPYLHTDTPVLLQSVYSLLSHLTNLYTVGWVTGIL